APTASTTKPVVRYAALSMWAKRYGKLGLKTMASQSAGCATPPLIWRPAGVCIQLFADRIQKAEIAVPIATMASESQQSQAGQRLKPNSSTPMTLASSDNPYTLS